MTAPWVTYADLPAPVPDLGGEEAWDAPIQLASEVLWALTGRRWAGVTTRTVEVVAPAPGCDPLPGWDASWGTAAHPAVVDGQIVNHRCCAGPPEVRLPGSPAEVISVTVRGATRDPSTYRLSGAYLQDISYGGWPTCDPGMVVVYLDGREPPEGGRTAAALLARELGKAQAGDPTCALPSNVTSVTRQGITQTMVSASELIAVGQTGLPSVDAWVATVNPARLTRRARAWSPETAPRTRRIP